MSEITPEGGFRTAEEKDVGKRLEKVFRECPDSIEVKLDNFLKYIRRQRLTRLLSLYEIFKRALPVKGSIIECGVYKGFGLMAWANMSAVLEPANLTRRIYGFDTFEGFPEIGEKDMNPVINIERGQLCSSSYEELSELIKIYDSNRFLGHVGKVRLIKGDVTKTIPEFISENRHLVVSLLFLDMDLYEPTRVAIENFFPRMPKGAIIAFDELDNPIWPGETVALMETIGINKLKIERIEFDPYIGFAVID
ncbi:MAG: TylF/MycF/NovP-related O-methyltransferase [Thermodesulfovibrionales bacterium]|nr:TylF/MycF/NovP-related O-methyltransferase [Thermodesulfovibrionales bacterium]